MFDFLHAMTIEFMKDAITCCIKSTVRLRMGT